MQASDQRLYTCGCAAYNGDREARRKWFSAFAPLSIKAAVPYSVLPSLVLAKAALESGYGTDLYESEFYEPQYGIKMARKATKHNNLIGMNAFPVNLCYLDSLPRPAWDGYKAIFNDFGPHFNGDSIELAAEMWKHYKSIEDCFEDWCANVRYQAEAHKKPWGMTIESQLLAIESYTPEGEAAETPGMHYAWQDYVLYLYHDYDLYAYDTEAYGMTVPMTQENLDEHIKRAYAYAHMHCHYAPCVTYPPMEDWCADCSGLASRALYTMGRMENQPFNIDDIHRLCEKAGLRKSTDINDVWRHHGIVCMQDKNNIGTSHINHVLYSLGGTSVNCISKYDLGSDERIQSVQPFRNVPVNEWVDRRNFLCVYCIPDEPGDKREDTPAFDVETKQYAKITKTAGIYAGAGTAWRRKGTVNPGDEALSCGLVTNDKGNQWRYVKLIPSGLAGYVAASAVQAVTFSPHRGTVSGTPDGFLALRIGAGTDCYKVAEIPEGDSLRVDGTAEGGTWLHVKWRGKRGFASAMYVKRA